MSEDSICIEVNTKLGELTIRLLNKIGIVNKKFKIKKNQNSLYVPIIHKPNESELEFLKKSISDFQILITSFSLKKNPIKKIDDLLDNQIPKHLLKSLPQSMDFVGDIAIIEIPFELKKYSEFLARAVLKIHKNVKTVLSKSGPITGNYRLRSLKFLAGENRTQTIHIEFGCKYYLDIAKVYFSPRLSQEHNRVASLVGRDEVVLDLFAGVGPFSIPIAKNNPEARIISVDLNPDAIEFLKKNIRLNRVDNNIIPFVGDARQLINKNLVGLADRVIMNLPETAKEFIDVACKAIKPRGGIIHYYEFMRIPDSIEKVKHRFSKRVQQAGRIVDRFLFVKNIREIAPFRYQIAFDVIIH
ncbi:MAG: class I SAM-dependent methyltransferase family protein [Candidatus Bathyarchaeota archaeon]|nr:class I SAM-dependent methyltransferase family protein [Candidatus Bathyarchaeota archaeon]